MTLLLLPTTAKLLSLLLILLLNNVVHASYTLTIAPKDEECFFVSYPHGPSTIFGDYDLLDNSSPRPLSVVFMDVEKERVLYRSRRYTKEGTFKVKLNEGQKASICIQNGIADVGRARDKGNVDELSRTVGFQFAVEPQNDALELHTINGKLIQSTNEVSRELRTLENHFEYMRAREGIHRSIVENTYSTLLFWTILEALTLVAVMTGQIMYIRRFLEKRRYI